MAMETFPIIRPEGRVILTIEVYEENGATVCGIHQMTGRIDLRPKAWIGAVSHELAKLERIARGQGCTELRVAGRDWSRVLKPLGYVPYQPAENTNGLKKVL